MADWVRALAALTEDHSLVLRAHGGGTQPPLTIAPLDPMGTHIHIIKF